MKITHRISLLANILLASICLLLLLQPGASRSHPSDVPASPPPTQASVISDNMTPDDSNPIEVFAVQAPFVTQNVPRAYPGRPPAPVVAQLTSKRAMDQTDHFAFLLEYGLRVHQKYLEHTKLSRELPLKENMMLAEFVRLAELPEYTSAHEAGWLNSQFYGGFNWTGHSSYQIYVWAKEHTSDILNEERYPNRKRIMEILEAVDNSSLNGVGGGMVCHYGCI